MKVDMTSEYAGMKVDMRHHDIFGVYCRSFNLSLLSVVSVVAAGICVRSKKNKKKFKDAS